MEINVNRLLEIDTWSLTGSVATHGKNVGKETWAAALSEASENHYLSADQLDTFKSWVSEFGCYEDDELAAWSHAECDAWLVQYATQDLREAQSLCPNESDDDTVGDIDWKTYKELSEEGSIGGNLFEHNGELWIMLG